MGFRVFVVGIHKLHQVFFVLGEQLQILEGNFPLGFVVDVKGDELEFALLEPHLSLQVEVQVRVEVDAAVFENAFEFPHRHARARVDEYPRSLLEIDRADVSRLFVGRQVVEVHSDEFKEFEVPHVNVVFQLHYRLRHQSVLLFLMARLQVVFRTGFSVFLVDESHSDFFSRIVKVSHVLHQHLQSERRDQFAVGVQLRIGNFLEVLQTLHFLAVALEADQKAINVSWIIQIPLLVDQVQRPFFFHQVRELIILDVEGLSLLVGDDGSVGLSRFDFDCEEVHVEVVLHGNSDQRGKHGEAEGIRVLEEEEVVNGVLFLPNSQRLRVLQQSVNISVAVRLQVEL